jgi:hypothetical protein
MKYPLIFGSDCCDFEAIVRKLIELVEGGSLLDGQRDSTVELHIACAFLGIGFGTFSLLKESGGGVIVESVKE